MPPIDSSLPHPETEPTLPLNSSFPAETWPGDPDEAPEPPTSWVWEGYLAPGNVTLLTSQWKLGKTTLLSVLLARLKTGGELAGLPVMAGKALVVSEESRSLWRRRQLRLDFGKSVCLLSQPFRVKPSMEQWLALIGHIVKLHEKHGFCLVVIDTLGRFLPGRTENLAPLMMEALLPLGELTSRGIAVLLLHHPRKGELVAGQAGRGSGALNAHVDISIELDTWRAAFDKDRRRRLRAFSRFEETVRELVIALNADGTDYEVTDDDSAEQFITAWPVLHSILETARTRMTRKMLLQRWPPGCVRPGKVTLWIWLERAYTRNLVHRAGHGRRNYPFSYCLPEKMEEFQHLPEEFVRCPELHEFKVFPTDAAELQAIIKRNEAERLGPVVPVIRPSDVLKRRRREDEEEGPFPDGEDVEPRDVG